MAVLSRIETLFDPAAPRGEGLLGLIVSDYLAYYGPPTTMRERWAVWGSKRPASPRRLALLFVPRVLTNPCIHATILLRLARRSPRITLGLWRTILIAKHSIDIQRQVDIGPGLVLPHPIGIVFGNGVQIGSNATVLHGVSIGGNPGRGGNLRDPGPGERICPSIGDDVVIYANSTLIGGISIGDEAVIGGGAWVERDVAPRSVQPGSGALYRELLTTRER